MPTCPNGHQSGTDDWCEVCGMRMAAPSSSSYGTRPPSASSSASSSSASSSASPVSTSPGVSSRAAYDPDMTAAAELCPECGTPREGAALFCEECRYNFRTHSATTFVAPPPPPPTAPGFPPYQRYESQRSRPSQVNRPAEPVPDASVTVTSGSGDFLLDPPSTPVPPAPPVSPITPVAPAPRVAPVAPTVPAEPEERMAPVVRLPVRPQEPEAGPDSSSGQAAAGRGTAWIAVVGADREYFTTMMARSGPEAQGLYFPAFSPEVQLPLIGNQITIGRRRHSTGEAPDIDLSRAPEDPGVSHQHAVLVQQPDGSWAVVDQDSTNGTTVNLGEDTIRPYTPVPLAEGDRVHVGAWTTITLRRV
ncbi:FHA domain-containing protein [Streptomyces sp. NPDC051976]|uniref:FHA domain-containing protein n=1 Tax=Streptomyces sp. NPDC051976 TaxID=3154947 RepID=UPI0034266126